MPGILAGKRIVGFPHLLVAGLIGIAWSTPCWGAGTAIVEFELVTEAGFPLTGSQQWLQMMAQVSESSVRIRQAAAGDQASVENRGTADQPIYHVVGILTGRNRLRLPGGEFGLADGARLSEWIKKLQTDGVGGPTAKTTVFGLTEEQLVAYHDKLAVPIRCASKDRRAGDVARDIVKGLNLPFAVSDAARAAFQSQEKLPDDLATLSSGTALATAIRPLGLVHRPEKTATGEVRLWICDVRETEESWPIGWPLQEIPVRIAPKLFEYLKVSIPKRTLTDAMAAIQPRVELPFLMDHNALIRKDIRPSEVRVSFSQDRANYQKILDNLLFQAGLKSELRVDEANQPFLWISPR